MDALLDRSSDCPKFEETLSAVMLPALIFDASTDSAASSSSMKMRLTNTRLAFVQSGTEVAYFSDNKLYVTRLEAVEQISIGTAANGYLDIVTTPSGVGLKWRT